MPDDRPAEIDTPEVADEGENPFDEELERKALKTVKDTLEEADSDRSDRAKNWLIYYSFYRNHYDFGKDFPFRNQMVPPLAFALIETVTPRLANGLFGSRHFLKFVPVDNAEDVERAERVEQLVSFQLNTQMDFVANNLPALKGVGIYGTAIFEVGWDESEDVVVKRKPVEVAGNEQAGYKTHDVPRRKSQPTVSPLALYDFWIDPYAAGNNAIDEARYVIRCEEVSPAELRRRMEDKTSGYMDRPGLADEVPVGAAGEHDDTRGDQGETDYRDERRMALGLGSLWADQTRKSKRIKLYHYWGEFKEDDGTYTQKRIITTDNRQVVLFEDNPWGQEKPFLHMAPTVDPHEFYGISEIEVVEHLLEALIVNFNQIQDTVNLIQNPMYIGFIDALVDTSDILYPKPGAFIRVDPKTHRGESLDSIMQPVKVPDIRPGSFEMLDRIGGLIDKTSGVYDYTRGDKSDAANSTATGIIAIIGEANARFQHKVMVAQHQFIKRLGEWLLRLNARFLRPDTVIRVLNEKTKGGYDYVTIGLDVFDPEYDVEAVGAPMMGDRTMLRQQIMEFIAYIAGNPTLAQYFKGETWRSLLLQLIDLMDLKSMGLELKDDKQLAAEAQAQKVEAFTEELRMEEARSARTESGDMAEAQALAAQAEQGEAVAGQG